MPSMGQWLAMLLYWLGLGPAPAATEQPVKSQQDVVQPLPAAQQQSMSLPDIAGPTGRPLVVIDAGHGGRDPGASSPDARISEKDITLALVLEMRDALLASGRVRVALTRDDDRSLPLRERYEIARALRAGLFISVHADAGPDEQARGATIYTLSEIASDREAAELARRENGSELGGLTLSGHAGADSILIDLAQRESMQISAEFARLLHRESAAKLPFREQHHRFASLIVLKAPDVPSILFESGYLTSPDDRKYLLSENGRKSIADAMRRSIELHFARQLGANLSSGRGALPLHPPA
jgi:N-acetylmuramoyl-L-alanine amidase